MNYNEICLQTCEIAKEAGQFIREQLHEISSEKIESKGLHNYVTYVDKTTEQMIVKKLRQMIPEAGFIVEEGTIIKTGDKYNWIVDPLDGTTNYIHGLPPFAVSIALQEDDEIVVGVIYEVSKDECFYAWKGSKSFLNEKEIHVSMADKVTDSLIATGFPYQDYKHLDKFMLTVEYFMKQSHGLRRLGSAATDMAYVACGRFDAFYEYGLNPWDVAAGVIIIKQAGGEVSDFMGGNNFIFGGEIMAANAKIFQELFTEINRMLVKNP